ncbi:GTP-binding protein [Amorphus sp. 3PC139-8]|uniref:CobW family GTP-binding protein n=1 Tax=Amorphus sp. 3PC139-8 TaxID=2735676 RepID=UPI00345D313C
MTGLRAPVRVDVLTGFLGAGKTSLLRRLIAAGALPNTVFLVNEAADFPLDERLIGAIAGEAGVAAGAVDALAGRCVCCAVDSELREGLMALVSARGAGTLPAFDRVVVETSGMADPTPIGATIEADPVLKPRFRFGSVVALADGLNLADTLDTEAEALDQLIAADRILLTKADLAGPDVIDRACATIAAVNPFVPILAVDPKQPPADPWQGMAHHHAAAGKPHAHSHRHSLTAFVVRWPDPVDWATFSTWLSLLLHRHGDKILRLKGLIRVAGEAAAEPVVVQAVRHLVYPPEHLRAGVADDLSGAELAVIARGIDADRLARSFAAFMGLSGTEAAAQLEVLSA